MKDFFLRFGFFENEKAGKTIRRLFFGGNGVKFKK